MKKIQKPTNNISTILDNCTSHMTEPRKTKIEQVKSTIYKLSQVTLSQLRFPAF